MHVLAVLGDEPPDTILTAQIGDAMMPCLYVSGALAVAGVCTVMTPAGVAGQTSADSVQVIVVAFDSVLGDAPYRHPGGSTSRICFDPRGALPPWEADSASVPDHQLGSLAERLSSAYAVEVIEGCQPVRRSTYGSWIVDEHENAAIMVWIRRQHFTSPDQAVVYISEVRAGRFAKAIECDVAREERESRWRVISCRNRGIARA